MYEMRGNIVFFFYKTNCRTINSCCAERDLYLSMVYLNHIHSANCFSNTFKSDMIKSTIYLEYYKYQKPPFWHTESFRCGLIALRCLSFHHKIKNIAPLSGRWCFFHGQNFNKSRRLDMLSQIDRSLHSFPVSVTITE